jgi:hypothetical protein
MEQRQIDLGLVEILERVRAERGGGGPGERRGARRGKAAPKAGKRGKQRPGRRERGARKKGRR